jgi:hypothetical protein
MAAASSLRRIAILIVITLTTPAVLGVEHLARRFVVPAEWEEIRRELNPIMTPVGWVLLALTVVSIPIAFVIYRALSRRLLAKVEAIGGGPKQRATARLEAMFVATSAPQIPAALAALSLSFGSDALPVLLAVGLSAAAAAAIGVHDRSA